MPVDDDVLVTGSVATDLLAVLGVFVLAVAGVVWLGWWLGRGWRTAAETAAAGAEAASGPLAAATRLPATGLRRRTVLIHAGAHHAPGCVATSAARGGLFRDRDRRGGRRGLRPETVRSR